MQFFVPLRGTICGELMNLEANQNIALLIAEKTPNPVILTDADRRIEWVNKAFVDISGYTLEDIKGKRPDFLYGPKTDKKIIDRIEEKLQKAIFCKEEIEYHRKDGSTYWVDVDILPIADDSGKLSHFINLQQDITEKKEHQEIIRKSEQKLRAIYNSTKERNVLIDRNLRVLSFNQRVADDSKKYFNREMKEGDPITDYLLNPKMVENLKENVNKVTESREEIEKELLAEYPDGEKVWFHLTYYPVFDDNNNIYGISLNLVDITKRKTAEGKIIRQNLRLREIARMQSHEVRRPLTNILGLSALIDTHDLDLDKQKFILEKLKISASELDLVVKKVVNTTVNDN